MRGGLERWKRGAESHGVRQAIAYAFDATCDAHRSPSRGAAAASGYGSTGEGVTRFVATDVGIATDQLDTVALRLWIDGCDPATGERRGFELMSPDADLLLDGTINAPKSYSIAALLHPEIAREFEALQDRLRDRIITTWLRELNARRGAGGRIRESLARIEVVELQHRRSRALDPHIHRHLWLNVKVQGRDGRWSNVDSRVAMRLHTLINAEGDLAARTDPQWAATLARNGYSLDADGEISELSHVVRPLSRRSNQIEAHRARFIAEWRAAHAGQVPSPDVLHQIDRRAWATSRPGKPIAISELDWEERVRAEIAALDDRVLVARSPIARIATDLDGLDLDMLAQKAIVDADARSTSYGGRFSLIDVRAGATRAVASSGAIATRDRLQPLIDAVADRALNCTVDLLAADPHRPQHIKALMATATVALKTCLADQFERLTWHGAPCDSRTISLALRSVVGQGGKVDTRQVEAAAAIAGTDRLVAVVGPAGAGKTSVLRLANAALQADGRRMIVVAPTRKAAGVASRELGATASSLHALLHDHGWRWARDDAGAENWRRLEVGVMDPDTGIPYPGPTRFRIRPTDRIVIDEAGMVDLHTAIAITELASSTGASIAMMGDPLQARPVGHSGAMSMLTHRATAVVELTTVHRFEDPDYAALTLRMREPQSRDDAEAVAARLDRLGHLHHAPHLDAARDLMVEQYFANVDRGDRVALVVATNDDADALNEAIQQRRLDAGELNERDLAIGQQQQRLLVGDRVQTRRNDRRNEVDNRALWVIRTVHRAGVDLVSEVDAGVIRTVSHMYAAEHLHLAYATTIHGIQGETVDVSIVGPGVDAPGLYVGMTRGRRHNAAVVIASEVEACSELATTMTRGRIEMTIGDAVRAARNELVRSARPVPTPQPGGYDSTIDERAQMGR